MSLISLEQLAPLVVLIVHDPPTLAVLSKNVVRCDIWQRRMVLPDVHTTK